MNMDDDNTGNEAEYGHYLPGLDNIVTSLEKKIRVKREEAVKADLSVFYTKLNKMIKLLGCLTMMFQAHRSYSVVYYKNINNSYLKNYERIESNKHA